MIKEYILFMEEYFSIVKTLTISYKYDKERVERILGVIGHLSQCINHGHGGCVWFSVGIQPILNVNPKY